MDALEFLKEYNRMCVVNKDCHGCPLKGTTCSLSAELSEEQITNIVDKTEQWSKEHPIITNARKFEEVFGKQPKFWNGTYYCPPTITEDCCDSECKTCNKWWDKPYKEPEKGA